MAFKPLRKSIRFHPVITSMRLLAPLLASSLLLSAWTFRAEAQAPAADPAATRETLMVVVRESAGANKQDEVPRPMGKIVAKLPDGREITTEIAAWDFIGDTHVRFVFDRPDSLRGARPQDLERLGLTRFDDALELALANVKRVYGEPKASEWSMGVMQVKGKSPDLDSTYFLDRGFWRTLLKRHPDGVVVAVPKRGGLLYAPVSDARAVDALRNGVVELHSSSGNLGVSAALYLFKSDRWSVFQAAPRR